MQENKKKISVLIISVCLVLVLIVGVSYAYFSRSGASNARTVQAGLLRIQYADDNTNTVVLNNIAPIYDADIQTKANKIGFTVTNTGSSLAYVSISLTDMTIPNELKNSDFKWALYSGNTKIKDGNFSGATTPMNLIKNEQIASSASKSYQLFIWISETGQEQNSMMNKTFSAKILIEGSQYEQQTSKLLTQKIIEDNSPVVTTTPNFANTATTDEGLIAGTDSDGTTYYFRGAVEDNYLKVAGLKWTDTNDYHTAGEDIIFRIVRVNGSGTTRIIMEQPIGESTFNNDYDNEKYVGYTYDNGKSCTNASPCSSNTGTNSTIKSYVEDWYDENMITYDSLFAIEKFCNDTSENVSSYGALSRLNKSIPEPNFICPSTDKYYGGEYLLKTGLLSADEAVFAGGKINNAQNYYLKGIGGVAMYSFLLLGSPLKFENGKANIIYLFGNGFISYGPNVNIKSIVIPVLNLKSDVKYKSGTGIQSDPYVVGLD